MNAKYAAIMLLGLAVTTPSRANPGIPFVPLMVAQVGQAEETDVRRESEGLLRRARQAMKGGNLELAERFVSQAEQLNVKHDRFLAPFVDHPQKARKDLEKLKATVAKNGRGGGGLKPSTLNSEVPRDSSSEQPERLPNELTERISDGPVQAPAGAIYPNTGQMELSGQAPGGQIVPNGMGRQQHGLSMMAQAKAALDRGDFDTAEKLTRQASSLRIPDGAFQGGDTPWEMMMRISKQRRMQQGVQPATATQPAPGQGPAGQVAPAIYDPEQDQSYVRTASGEELLSQGEGLLSEQGSLPGLSPLPEQPAPIGGTDEGAIEPSGIAPAPSPAPSQPNGNSSDVVEDLPIGADQLLSPETTSLSTSASSNGTSTSGLAPTELMKKGEDALRADKLNEARDLFLQAWAYEGQLDQTTRQRLKDHLQFLQVNKGLKNENASKEQQEQLRIRRFLAEVTRDQAAIAQHLQVSPKEAWEQMKELRTHVMDSDLPEDARKPIVKRLDRAVEEIERFIEQNRSQIELDEKNREVLATLDRERKMRRDVSHKLAGMVDSFNELMDQQRYSEAYLLAKQARDLDPDSPVTENMLWKSLFARNMLNQLSIQDRTGRGLEGMLNGVEEAGIAPEDEEPIRFADGWKALVEQRKGSMRDRNARLSDSEIQIYNALKKKVRVQFDNKPLSDAVQTLGKLANINVYLDAQGLAAEGVTSSTPVNINLDNEIGLDSVLKLILEPLRLSYVVQNEVLKITSEQVRAGDVYQDTYYVGDLVIPIPNFLPGYNSGMAGALAQAHAALGYGPGLAAGQAPPLAVLAESGKQLGNQASVLAQMNSTSMLPGSPQAPQPMGFGPGGMGGGSLADFDTLIQLIESTVAPDSWDTVGGPGSMAQFDGNLSLVISNTQEVHEQIVSLLEQLRRLQDLQVTIEVRFITLQDNFFERIGVDFDFDIRDNTGLVQADLAGDNPNRNDIVIGLDPANGNPTIDLDLKFSQNSFASAIPQFGGFDPASANTFGFAILSDIEAFFVMSAIQGDSRTNIMQAPKITLFNGQFATLNDTSSRPFVTSVIPVVGDFAAAQQPVILVLAEGTQLSVQAVVSSDRRFVRLTLLPMFSQIGDVDTFTFEGRRSSSTGTTTEVDSNDDTSTTAKNDEEFTEGTTVQLPTFASTSVSTTVSVPDGGTVLLGGIKRLAEGRNERGMPILGKLPYISRLFKNVGIGRETQTLMMMVTPRIIIQEEEEEKVLGTPTP